MRRNSRITFRIWSLRFGSRLAGLGFGFWVLGFVNSAECASVLTPAASSTTTTIVHPAHDYPVKPVPFTSVHLTDTFWAPRIETNRLVTIPFAFEQCERSGRMDNFLRAAIALQGGELTNRRAPPYPFDDSDPY